MALNRTPFNALVDDDGTNLTGTIWDKAHIKNVILDPVDAELIKLVPLAGGANLSGPLQVAAGTTVGTAVPLRPLTLWGSDSATSGIVASLYTKVSGRASALHFSDSFTYHLSIGSDAAGSFTVWAGRAPGVAGAAVLTLSAQGVLAVTGFGAHTFTAGGTGVQSLKVVNPTNGATNSAAIYVGNDANVGTTFLQSLSSSNTAGAPSKAGGSVLGALGAGGLSIAAQHASGAIRFYAGGTVERMQIRANGDVFIGTSDVVAGNLFAVLGPGRFNIGNPGTAVATAFAFYNANGTVGTIQTSGSGTIYNTVSDQRLKQDLGIAENLTALRAVVVHDFIWRDGTQSRGVFAQETAPVFPRAIAVGSPGTDLSRPWMADYSTFIPDLIVGWQQHDARLTALEARLKEN